MAKKSHNINVKINSRSVYSTEVSLGKKPLNHYPAKQNVLMTLTNSGSNSYRITVGTESGD